MNIVGIDSIVYGVDDVDAAVRFHQDWGLTTLERGASARNFDPSDPSFHGHAWNARPEQAGRRPADLHDD